ncbi:MAG: class I SAM-dependent methyltransferase [Lachnospiraceae bacterium]|nr:class I SAM-dependent methyltransferase [Lachnospiraceae bacterium]
MWISDRWTDYEVLECSGGEKLERWGSYLLVRPDPQVIWDSPRTHAGWNHNNGVYHRSDKGGGNWELHDLPQEWDITWTPVPGAVTGSANGDPQLVFRLKPFQFKHTGLFPEQAANWDWFMPIIAREAARREENDPVRVLNLFAYTGGATVAAAAAGAHVTHVDAAKGMVGWAKENFAVSGLAERPARFLVDDCVKFVQREIRRGKTYDAVILDPPSYGRGPGGEVWKLEDAIYGLLTLLKDVVSDRPLFFLLNSYTTGLQPLVMKDLMALTLASGRNGTIEADELALPVTGTAENDPAPQNIALPCGASARWCGEG